MQCITWYAGPDTWAAIGSCVSAAISVAAFVGLVYYVIYTKRMMKASEATLRATIEPILVVDPDDSCDNGRTAVFRVSNAGNGPALETLYWYSNDPQEISNFTKFIGRKDDQFGTPLGLVPPNGQIVSRAVFPKPSNGEKSIFVVQARDSAQGIHQYQMVYMKTDANNHTVSSYRVRKP